MLNLIWAITSTAARCSLLLFPGFQTGTDKEVEISVSTFLHPWKGRKRAQPIRAVIASAISPKPVCEWVFRKLNAIAGKHKLPLKKKILPLIPLVSLLGKEILSIVSVNFLSDHPTQSKRWRTVTVWMASWVPILKSLDNVRNYFWVYTWIIFFLE